jgi:Universal stress protein UspA and related nucleotide-binding proteins
MRYIVATDGSPQSDKAVRYATKHALAFDATIELVNVITPGTGTVEGQPVFEGEDVAADEGRRMLDRTQDIIRDAAVQAGENEEDNNQVPEIKLELLTGRPAHAIARQAMETDADAIYVGHRGLSSDREKVVGSVAKGIIDEAEVPVTIVR